MPARATSAAIGLLVGVAALLIQVSLSIPARLAQGRDLLDALIWFFTYFTILTNIMLVLIYLSELYEARWLAWWRSPVTRGMMAGSIALVMGFYHFVLAATWSPEGWFLLADVLLHYATPIIYLLWWLVLQPKGALGFRDMGWMLLPPLVWLGWTMARGALVNEYPYPVLEAQRLGYGQVAVNIGAILLILLVLFALVVMIDRLAGRRRART